MNTPHVSIIILNWNGYIDTIDCIESLKKITYPNHRIIVVDNASSGDDVRILKDKYDDYINIVANDKNYGFPEGCNFGIRHAFEKGTDYILLLNNDTIVDPEFLTILVQTAEADKLIGVVGSAVYYYYYPNKIQYIGGKINGRLRHKVVASFHSKLLARGKAGPSAASNMARIFSGGVPAWMAWDGPRMYPPPAPSTSIKYWVS